jgi:plastocyanin
LASNIGSVRARRIAAPWLLAALLACNAQAARLQVAVTGSGAPAADAVVSLHSPAAVAATRAGRATIDQRASQFVPRVTVVTVGTPVVFPNSDNVRHQVY